MDGWVDMENQDIDDKKKKKTDDDDEDEEEEEEEQIDGYRQMNVIRLN